MMLRTMGLFNPPMRELVEMLYQFERPFLVPRPRSHALRAGGDAAAGGARRNRALG